MQIPYTLHRQRLDKSNKKRKLYLSKPAFLFYALLVAIIVPFWHYYNLTALIETPQAQALVTQATTTPDLSIEDYIMQELEKNNINKYKAWSIINCESGFNPNAININKNGTSLDLGVWQLNTKYQPNISNVDKMDYKKSTAYAIALIKKQGFAPWTCAKLLNIK